MRRSSVPLSKMDCQYDDSQDVITIDRLVNE